jgi:hypothetical protein
MVRYTKGSPLLSFSPHENAKVFLEFIFDVIGSYVNHLVECHAFGSHGEAFKR